MGLSLPDSSNRPRRSEGAIRGKLFEDAVHFDFDALCPFLTQAIGQDPGQAKFHRGNSGLGAPLAKKFA